VTRTPAWLLRGPQPGAFTTPERCTITEILNDPACPALSLARAEVAPDVATQLHALDGITECYVIRSGRGRAEIGGESAEVGPGDRVVIGPGIAQRITNIGAEPLVFDCLCTPRFRPECYRALGP
jgi:mannose-6-phosphate isomerase-like protein (cupin superfamily)